LSTPSPSSCTTCACTPACRPGRAACSPEPELPRLPPGSHCRARTSAYSPSQWALVAPHLGHTEALCAAHCPAVRRRSQEFEQPRPRRHHAPSVLAGDPSGPATPANRSWVRPITTLWCLFANPGPTSPVASLPRRRGHPCVGCWNSRA
jgi:hypothetical protein